MVSTMHLESFGGIDNWDWAKASKIKSGLRAPRRPKVYPADNKKTIRKMRKGIEGRTSRCSKVGAMSDLESEKMGVTILGQRFRDYVQSVPIKKRRYLQWRSPSPPGSPSQSSEASESSLSREGGETIHHFNADCKSMKCNKKMNSGTGRNASHDIPCDTADFSGISILAAAACNSGVGGDIISSEASVTKEQDEEISHVVSERAESHNLLTDNDDQQIIDNHTLKTSSKPFSATGTLIQCKEEDVNTMGESEILEEQQSNSHSMHISSNKTSNRSSTRDERFHWDLNKPIDVWEDPDVGFFDSEDPLAIGSSRDASKPDGANIWPGQVVSGISKNLSDFDNYVCSEDKLKDTGPLNESNSHAMNGLSFNHSNTATLDTDRQSPSFACTGNSANSKHFVLDGVGNLADEKHATDDSWKKCLGFEAVKSDCKASDHSHKTIAADGMSYNDHFKYISGSANEGSGSQQDVIVKSCILCDRHHSKKHTSLDLHTREAIVQDSEPSVGVDILFVNQQNLSTGDVYKLSDDTSVIDSQINATTSTGDPHISTPLITDSVTNRTLDSHDQKTSAGAQSYHVELNEFVESPSSGPCQRRQSERIVTTLSQDLAVQNYSDNSAINDTGVTTEPKKPISKCSVVIDNNPNSEIGESRKIINRTGDISVSVDPSCEQSVDAVNDSKAFVENGSEFQNCDSVSNPVKIDHKQPVETEKMELHEDDDSQYEDGEFRECMLFDCQLDGSEGESERVDYGSDDDRDAELYAASPGLHESSLVGQLTYADSGYKPEKVLEESNLQLIGNQTPKRFNGIVSKDYQTLNTEAEKVIDLYETMPRERTQRRLGSEKLSRDNDNDMQVGPNSKNTIGSEHYSEDGDGTKKSTSSSSLKVKSSGWDCMPQCSRVTCDVPVDRSSGVTSTNQSGATDKYAVSRKKDAGTIQKKETLPRTDRQKSLVMSRRQDQTYFLGKRFNPDESSMYVERDDGHTTSTRRDGSSLPRHERRGRPGDTWDRSAKWGLCRHKSPSNYDSSDFSQSNLRNIGSSSTMKLDSDAFDVESDVTLVASGVEGTVRTSRQNPPLQAPRRSLSRRNSPSRRDGSSDFDRSIAIGRVSDTSQDRHASVSHGRPGRYDSRMVNTSLRGRYNGAAPDESDSLPIRPTFSRRDHNYSSERNPIRLSKAPDESFFQSRARSPHVWTSPMRKIEGGMNGSRRWSRSPPNFRPAARVERLRSPHQRSSYVGRVPDFVPLSRSNVSPSHDTRWIDQRNDMEDPFCEHEYRRSSGRSPPTRLFSRSRRFDMDNGRSKVEEYHRSGNPRRFSEFAISRRPKFDPRDDRRGHDNRYEIFDSPPEQYDIVDDMKHLSYDIDDEFRLNNSRYKGGSNFDARASPARFDHGIEDHIDSPPRRSRDHGGPFRFGRDVRQGSSFRSFRIRECDITTQRRRLS